MYLQERPDLKLRYCGLRVPYYKHHTGLCMLQPHGPEVEHLVEVVTIDTALVDYWTIGD